MFAFVTVGCNPYNLKKYSGIGLPVPSTEVKFMDDEGNEVSRTEGGEMGSWPSGHERLNRPDATAEVLHDGWVTGDIATMDDEGFIRIIDRKKDMILVSGFNVYPNED